MCKQCAPADIFVGGEGSPKKLPMRNQKCLTWRKALPPPPPITRKGKQKDDHMEEKTPKQKKKVTKRFHT